MRLKKLIENTNFSSCFNLQDSPVVSITDNSHKVKKGSMFAAIEGSRYNGHDFIDEAICRGATVLLLSDRKKFTQKKEFKGSIIYARNTREVLSEILAKFYNNHKLKKAFKIFGITGTNGKTTTSLLIFEILKNAGKKPGKFTTIDFDTGKKKGISEFTTPDVFTIQRGIKEMIQCKYDAAVLELSSHGIDQFRIHPSQVDVAVLTNITRDHLDYHKNIKSYVSCKRKLFEKLNKNSIAVINKDEEVFNDFKKSTSARVVSYGINKKSDFTANNIENDYFTTRFVLNYPDGNINIESKMIGGYNIYNILAALTSGYLIGLDMEKAALGIKKFTSVKGRLQEVKNRQGIRIFIDYAHTPDALKQVLKALKNETESRLILVFGCGGNRDSRKRPLMGRIAAEYSDYIIITNDNPRNEDPQKIVFDIKKGINNNVKLDIIMGRKEAIYTALNEAASKDIVLIAGKGHEPYQIIANQKIDFDDYKVVREVLKTMK